jgi:hypothetical protein
MDIHQQLREALDTAPLHQDLPGAKVPPGRIRRCGPRRRLLGKHHHPHVLPLFTVRLFVGQDDPGRHLCQSRSRILERLDHQLDPGRHCDCSPNASVVEAPDGNI